MKYFLPQYAAHAVADMERLAKSPVTASLRQYREVLTGVSMLLRNAVHVVLPEDGQIYRTADPVADMPTEDECVSFSGGLPAPVTSFEYSWSAGYNQFDAGRVVVRAPRRITLIIDGRQLSDVDDPPEGFQFQAQMFSVFYDEIQRVWMPHKYSISIATPLVCNRIGPTKWGFLSGGAIDNMTFEKIPSWDERGNQAVTDFLSDISVATQACHALRAGAELHPQQENSPTRRRKFEKRGVGGFTYHVLKLPHGGSGRTGEGGTHASPRLHVRRAHIRKLPSGALTFVRQCFVGDPERGRVDKHYRVGR